MTLGVESAAPRMRRLLGYEQAEQILNGLRTEIARQRIDVEIPFQWDLEIYRNPPINWDPSVAFVSKLTADLDSVRAEAVELVNMEDDGGVINGDMTLVNVGDYVIVKGNLQKDSLKRPFWVGHVSQNNVGRRQLRVHWLLPPTTHTGRSKRGAKETEESMMMDGEEPQGRTAAPHPSLSYVTPCSVPKERRGKPQEPNRHCILKHYPYAQFRPVLDLNTTAKSHSNKGLRKAIHQTHPISYDCCFFFFPELGRRRSTPT